MTSIGSNPAYRSRWKTAFIRPCADRAEASNETNAYAPPTGVSLKTLWGGMGPGEGFPWVANRRGGAGFICIHGFGIKEVSRAAFT